MKSFDHEKWISMKIFNRSWKRAIIPIIINLQLLNHYHLPLFFISYDRLTLMYHDGLTLESFHFSRATTRPIVSKMGLQLNHNRITLGNHDSNGAGKHTEVHTEGSVIFDDRDASACDPRSSVHARSLLKDHWVTPIEQRGFPLAIRIISIPIKARFISNKFLMFLKNVLNLRNDLKLIENRSFVEK